MDYKLELMKLLRWMIVMYMLYWTLGNVKIYIQHDLPYIIKLEHSVSTPYGVTLYNH